MKSVFGRCWSAVVRGAERFVAWYVDVYYWGLGIGLGGGIVCKLASGLWPALDRPGTWLMAVGLAFWALFMGGTLVFGLASLLWDSVVGLSQRIRSRE